MLIESGPADGFDRDEIMAGLNGAFGHWGDARLYDWAFRRVVAGVAPDLVVAREGGRIIASSAVMYRSAVSHEGRPVRAALIGGSWTAPEARQRGIFGVLLSRSLEVAASRGASLITGMGREENVSRLSFERLRFALLPSAYCRSVRATASPKPVKELEPDPRHFPAPAASSHFVYSDEEWLDQFVRRPEPVDCVGREGEWIALLERGTAFDRVLALHAADPHLEIEAIDQLVATAHASGRRLFLFTADAHEAARLAESGFETVPGYVPLWPGEGFSSWWLRHGDRA